MSEEDHTGNHTGIDLNEETVLPSGKKLYDCDMVEVTANAMALLKFVYTAVAEHPDLSDERRADFIREIRSFADTGEGSTVQ